jgi:hypothetical protein
LISYGKCVRSGLGCLLLAGATAIGACSLGRLSGDDSPSEPAANLQEETYKPDILAMLRVYLNDPTQVRDAVISEPMPEHGGKGRRFLVCLRLNARKSNGEYAGIKEYAAIFVAGRLDQLIEAKGEQCAAAEFRPFPEAEKLSR